MKKKGLLSRKLVLGVGVYFILAGALSVFSIYQSGLFNTFLEDIVVLLLLVSLVFIAVGLKLVTEELVHGEYSIKTYYTAIVLLGIYLLISVYRVFDDGLILGLSTINPYQVEELIVATINTVLFTALYISRPLFEEEEDNNGI